MTTKGIIKLSVLCTSLILLWILLGKTFETVNAGEIVIIQSPTGKLTMYNTPGIKPQMFGTVTRYKKSFQYWFNKVDNDHSIDNSIKVRFNDGGHGQISGSCRIDLPVDAATMLLLHQRYGSQEGIERSLIKPVLEKSVYFTGPLMSSKESSSTRRNDLITLISDQAEHGVYKTRQIEIKAREGGSDSTKIITIVEILKDGSGNYLRQEISPFTQIRIGFNNLSINSLDYDSAVEKQIRSQQELAMQEQTSMARAKTAEQLVYTTQKEGEAKAAQAKWEQEAIKAQRVTEAEQELAVQELKEKKAASYEQEQIRIGRGDGERKRLAMVANGALDVKLEAWIKSQQFMWDAFSKYTGSMVPQFQMGGAGGTTHAMDFMQLMSAKAMKDLSLNLDTK